MNFREFLKNNIVILDGGTGTVLQARGLKPGEATEEWNLSHPDEIVRLHKEYYDAGSNVVFTNTFGATALKYNDEELERLISSALASAKKARELSIGKQEKFIGFDIGSLGALLKPFGEIDFEEAVSAFAKVVKLAVKYGAELIGIETMNDSYETKAALLAVKESCDLPVMVSNAYSADGKLMTGASPEAMVAMLEGMGADIIGANCSLGPEQLQGVIEKLLSNSSVPVSFKPNAGLPKSENGKTYFDITPEQFAQSVAASVKRGVRVVGGCCGTTPEYIRLLTQAIGSLSPVEITPKDNTVISSFDHAVYFGTSPLLIGERINPTGKKMLKQALIENDIQYILNEGVNQQSKGVDILDVNVGLPDIDECRMLTDAVCELQAITSLPLQIDTSDPVAMEAALRRYNGKAMINSVNGKEESIKSVFPIAKKYGGVIVALTLDENGIPKTAEGRVAIAEKILKAAEGYGISKKDIIFDTLAMTVSADCNAAVITLKSLREIKERLGCNTVLGVSNVSFGLPERDILNSNFFALALENGLSAAIMNPFSAPMMRAYYSFRALHAMDESCLDYIDFALANPSAVQPASVSEVKSDEGSSELQRAIINGFRDAAGVEAEKQLQSVAPLDIVQKEIIPALNIVGKGFEEKKYYLPQLLMSAEAAKSAFEKIKAILDNSAEKKASTFPVVIATVKGDIHDIGKNIVKLLLENYGFEVTDLGKDVEPETVLNAVNETGAKLVGLSALMTTTVPAMEETIVLLRRKAPQVKIIVGGAVLNKEYAERIGADAYAPDAMETVRYAQKLKGAII